MNDTDLKRKIIVSFIVISILFSALVIIVTVFQRNSLKQAITSHYMKRYEKIVLTSLNDSLDSFNKLNKELAKNTGLCEGGKNKPLSAHNTVFNRLSLGNLKIDYAFIFKNSQLLYGISKQNGILEHNPLNFIPKKQRLGFVKFNGQIYLYSALETNKNTNKNRCVIVLLKSIYTNRIISKTAHISLSTPKHYSLKTDGRILVGVYKNSTSESVIIFDIFKKPAASLVLSPNMQDILSIFNKIIIRFFIILTIAAVLGFILSYVVIKYTVLNNMEILVKSIKNIHSDLTLHIPKFKSREFEILSDTLKQLTERVKESEYMFNRLSDSIPVGVIVYRELPIFSNRYANKFFGRDMTGIPLMNFIDEKDKPLVKEIKERRIRGDDFFKSYKIKFNTPQSKIAAISSSTITYNNKPAGLIAFVDVTKDEILKSVYKIINSVNEVIFKNTNEEYLINSVCEALSKNSEISFVSIRKHQKGKTIELSQCGSGKELQTKGIAVNYEALSIFKIKNYSCINIPVTVNGKVEYSISIHSHISSFFSDETKAVMAQMGISIGLFIENIRTEEEKTHMLFFDTLTGLKNFNSLEKDIKGLSSCVLIYINIRNFSIINQVYGFRFGDVFLKKFGSILRENIKSTDNVYRLNGDKFAILIGGRLDKMHIENLILRLKNVFYEFNADNRKIAVYFDAGVTGLPDYVSQKELLIESAETALTKSKDIKDICFYSIDMKKETEENFALEIYLKEAVEKKLFFFYYQPILNLNKNIIDKAEALIRLKDSEGKFINPERFIALAEKINIIGNITKIAVNTVFTEISEFKSIDISINLSSNDMENPQIVSYIEKNILKHKNRTFKISVELTERDAMKDINSTKEFIKKMRKLGVEIEIDDFGIGYSSLDRIVELDFDVLKIDKSLVDMIGKNLKAERIIAYLTKLAHSLGAKALAEGVETKEQFDFIKKQKCDYIQGYFISKPLPADKFREFTEQFNLKKV